MMFFYYQKLIDSNNLSEVDALSVFASLADEAPAEWRSIAAAHPKPALEKVAHLKAETGRIPVLNPKRIHALAFHQRILLARVKFFT